MELSEYGIQYKPRLSKKGKVLADFLAEIPQLDTYPDKKGWWALCVDEASRQSGALIGLQLTSPTGERIEQVVRLGFNATNNESEYEVMIAGLELALAMGADNLSVQSDSQLVVRQVNVEFEYRDPRMAKYASLVKRKLNTLLAWKIEHVPRDCNEMADALAVVAASLSIRETVFLPIYYQPKSSILLAQINQIEEVPPSWMDPIRLYIATGELPNDRDKATRFGFSRLDSP